MNNKQFFAGMLLAALLGGAVAVVLMQWMKDDTPAYATFGEQQQQVQLSKYLADTNFIVPQGINFVYAAERVRGGVVFIRSFYSGNSSNTELSNPFEGMHDFFGDPGKQNRGPSRSSGSGVIISGDGYIATNNHVIENAEKIEVTLDDNRLYEAEVVGTDPTTDLALLKIKAKNLPFVAFGNSDAIHVGEWVLAIGNPFGTLTSTVTAGIISAKARNINILRDQDRRQIESFIQTDAAVNQGNSGGALVNLKGELVGINTAIATPTGSYAGYSFAVPVSLVQKVMDDLLQYGTVQRALLGVSIQNMDAMLARNKGVDLVTGVYVDDVQKNSASQQAGIKPGDIILKIDDKKVNHVPELQELIARNRPGDKVQVTYWRDGETYNTTAVLQSIEGLTEFISKRPEVEIEGAVFVAPSSATLEQLSISSGAQVTDVGPGKWADAGLEKGFIVTSIDKEAIQSVEQLKNVMENKKGGILIEGITSEGKRVFYGYGW